MDLNKLWKRCSACRYKSLEDFKRDLALVASNCHLYCQDKFPTLPPAADAAVEVCCIYAHAVRFYISVAPVAYQVILEPDIGQFREFEPRRVHTRIIRWDFFLCTN